MLDRDRQSSYPKLTVGIVREHRVARVSAEVDLPTSPLRDKILIIILLPFYDSIICRELFTCHLPLIRELF